MTLGSNRLEKLQFVVTPLLLQCATYSLYIQFLTSAIRPDRRPYRYLRTYRRPRHSVSPEPQISPYLLDLLTLTTQNQQLQQRRATLYSSLLCQFVFLQSIIVTRYQLLLRDPSFSSNIRKRSMSLSKSQLLDYKSIELLRRKLSYVYSNYLIILLLRPLL